MASLPRKAFSLLLALILAAPANAGLSSWMALSMADSEDESVAAHQPQPEHSHHQHMVDDASHSGDQHADHDQEECNEHCVSCANHCSSLGILSDGFLLPDLARLLLASEPGILSNHSELLYRPPIHR